jgi:hypothetical protein
MSVLAPLYLAGLAALSIPLILHLVRRTPKGRQLFSSLMFLAPTPPTLTRRSRLDQILLLLLRLAALALLAFAFARPFLREAATLSMSSLPSRRVAILLDTSASMRRGDLWQQASKLIEKELADLNPHDDVALYTFSDRLQAVVPFDKADEASEGNKAALVRQQVKELRPTWAGTDLATALVAVAGDLDTSGDVNQSTGEPQIILVSDLQKGSETEALQAFEWPDKVRLILRPVSVKQNTNAYAHLLASEEDAPDADPRVRVVSAAGSAGDQFYVNWRSDSAATMKTPQYKADATAVYVPPGQSRVVKLPRPAGALLADRLAVAGDDHDFDNAWFVVPPKKQSVRLAYVGTDAADDAKGMQYYLRLAVAGDPLRQVEVTPLATGDSLGEPLPELIVVTRPISEALAGSLKTYAEQGGTVLIAPADAQAAAAIPTLVDGATLGETAAAAGDAEDEYLLLGEIDFTHPLFAPFANPKYSDFTKIHFWGNWPIKAPTSGRGDQPADDPQPITPTNGRGFEVIARFDNREPALIEQSRGKGRIIVLATNWRPADSQLALSSKFVPLVGGLVDLACGASVTLPSVAVNEPVALPAASESAETIVRKPDGKQVKLPVGAAHFTDTDQPGVYRAQVGTEEVQFAVNLPAAESDTAPLDTERLEQLGVRMGTDLTRAERLAQIRQQRDTELEDRQKVWRWLIVGVLGLVIVETWWAGRAARHSDKQIAETLK